MPRRFNLAPEAMITLRAVCVPASVVTVSWLPLRAIADTVSDRFSTPSSEISIIRLEANSVPDPAGSPSSSLMLTTSPPNISASMFAVLSPLCTASLQAVRPVMPAPMTITS